MSKIGVVRIFWRVFIWYPKLIPTVHGLTPSQSDGHGQRLSPSQPAGLLGIIDPEECRQVWTVEVRKYF